MLAYDAGATERAQARQCVVGQIPLLVGEVVDEICARLVVLAYVVVVDCLLDQPAGGNEIIDGRGGGVSLVKKRLAVDLAQHSTVALDARVRPDHLQIEQQPARPHCVEHIAQDVHDVLGLYSSE